MVLRDPFSSASHLLTAVWAAYATLVLLQLTRHKPDRRWAVGVFGASMVALYAASGVFHAVPYTKATDPAAFRFFQKLDHTAISLLIAGTNTPCLAVLVGGRFGRWLLRAMWGMAAAQVAGLWLLPRPPYPLTVSLYLLMGWLGGVPVYQYYRAVGWRAMNWVLAGAAFYTAGAACEVSEWPANTDWPVRFGYHEVFHLCDIAASLAFFGFVVRFVVPYRRPPAEGPPVAAPG